MKKKILVVILVLLGVFSLTSCSNNGKHYDPENYIINMEYKEDYNDGFKVLQLTDLHIGNKDVRSEHYEFIKETINEANPDFIVITGDLFTFATKAVARELFQFMNDQKINWTCTFGNHDEQCYFSVDWLTNELNSMNNSRVDGDDTSYCYFKDIQDDDVFGNANFAINLMDGSTLKQQFIIMDSNRYNFTDYTYYDYIHEDQIEWFKDLTDYTSNVYCSGNKYQSELFYHIPVPEFREAVLSVSEFKDIQNSEKILSNITDKENSVTGGTKVMGSFRENVCCADINTGFYKAIKESKTNCKAMLCGHDHNNDFVIYYDDMYFVYGITSTNRVYYTDGVTGGTLMSINMQNNELTFSGIYHDYK